MNAGVYRGLGRAPTSGVFRGVHVPPPSPGFDGDENTDPYGYANLPGNVSEETFDYRTYADLARVWNVRGYTSWRLRCMPGQGLLLNAPNAIGYGIQRDLFGFSDGEVVVCFQNRAVANQDMFGLYFLDGSGVGNGAVPQYDGNGYFWSVSNWGYSGTLNSFSGVSLRDGQPICLGIRRVGTTLTLHRKPNGGAWALSGTRTSVTARQFFYVGRIWNANGATTEMYWIHKILWTQTIGTLITS